MRIGHQNREPDETAERSEPVSAEDRTDDTDPYVEDVDDTQDTFTGRHAAGAAGVSDSDAAGITTPVYLHDTTAARDTAGDEDTAGAPSTPGTIRGETIASTATTGGEDTMGGRDATIDEDELAPGGSTAARDAAATDEDVMRPGGTTSTPASAAGATPVDDHPVGATVPDAIPADEAGTSAYAPSPRTAADTTVGSRPMIPGDQDLGPSWQRIQASFVDDPRASVTDAAALVEETAEAAVATIQERERTLRGSWEGNGNGTDTEKLRTALREYRDFYQKISQF